MKEDSIPTEVMNWSRQHCGYILNKLTLIDNSQLTDIVFTALNNAFHNNFVEESEYVQDGLGLSRLRDYCSEDKKAVPFAKEFIEKLKNVPDLCGYTKRNIEEFERALVA
jgi:hypothetical protein